MDVMKSQLQALLIRARTWEDRIRRTTCADRVVFAPDPSTGEFTLTTYWTTRAGVEGSFGQTFSRDFVFGPAARRGAQPRINRQLCSYMREYMQAALHSRGV